MAKLPSMQFYPGDWRKDLGVQSLSYHDRGVWFELLMLMFESEQRGLLLLNGRAMTDEQVARVLGLDIQIANQTLTTLLTTGVASREPSTGALMCRRMVRDENLRQIRTEAGAKGGNPHLVNQKSNQKRTTQANQTSTTGVNQNSTPSSSPSYSKRMNVSKNGLIGESEQIDSDSEQETPIPCSTSLAEQQPTPDPLPAPVETILRKVEELTNTTIRSEARPKQAEKVVSVLKDYDETTILYALDFAWGKESWQQKILLGADGKPTTWPAARLLSNLPVILSEFTRSQFMGNAAVPESDWKLLAADLKTLKERGVWLGSISLSLDETPAQAVERIKPEVLYEAFRSFVDSLLEKSERPALRWEGEAADEFDDDLIPAEI